MSTECTYPGDEAELDVSASITSTSVTISATLCSDGGGGTGWWIKAGFNRDVPPMLEAWKSYNKELL